MSLSNARRHNRIVSSNATRIYQVMEWLLILAISLKPYCQIYLESDVDRNNAGSRQSIEALFQHEALPWQLLLGCAVVIVVTTYEARSQWMSLLLYVVLLPQSVALIKCRSATLLMNDDMLNFNIQITIVSYLHAFLPYFRPLGAWTPAPATTIQSLGFVLSRDPFLATMHLHILQLGRELVGRSLNTIELSLLAHALSAFTINYLSSSTATLNHTSETFLLTFVYGLMVAVYPAIPILKRNMRLAKVKPHHRPKNTNSIHNKYALYVYLIITFMILTMVRSSFTIKTGRDPFAYVLEYLLNKPVRILLVLYWAFVSGLGVMTVVYFWGSKPVGGLFGFPNSARRLLRQSKVDNLHHQEVFFEEEDTIARRARALDRRRKFFHGLIVVLFFPTMNIDPDLSYLALSLAFTAFLFEEILRVTVLPPFGLAIHKFLSGFTDERDIIGHIVVSHLFLLLGVAGPVWLTCTAQRTSSEGNQEIAMLAGVLTLGAGDAAASIVGKKYGRHKWPASKKSIEGTTAFILAMIFGGYFAEVISSRGQIFPRPLFCIAVSLTGLLEAVSTQNDNLIIPVYMWSMIY